MIYEIYTENGTKKKRALTGNGYGLPLGTWISYEGTCPDGFLEAGTTFNTTTYAALYAMLGSNKVPERFDHSKLSDWETLSLPSAQVDSITMEYDGIIMASVEENQGRLYLLNFSQDGGNTWKNIVIDRDYSDTAGGSATLQLNKGDKVYYSINTTGYVPTVYAAYYKRHLAIKATPAYVEPDTVSDMVNTLRTQDSYSTEEVNTGKKWIDGRPIYRFGFTYIGNISANWAPVYSDATFMSNVDLVLSALLVDNTLLKGTYPAPSRTDNGVLQVFTQGGWYADKIFIEYVKTTD